MATFLHTITRKTVREITILQHIHILDTVFAGFFHGLKPMALFNILFFKTTCKIAILIIRILIIGIFGIVNV